MAGVDCLEVRFFYPIEAVNAGLFVSTGNGIHATRVLDTYELLFVTRGQLDLFEEEKSFTIRENQALILWPGRKHGGLCPFPADLSFYWLHFKVHAPEEPGMNAFVQPTQLTTVSRPERMIELFRRFLDDQEAGVRQPLAASHNVTLMLCELAHSAEAENPEEDNETVLAERISAYIASHFHEQISSSQIAAHLNYNPDYLERVFRREKHLSITSAIHYRRIKEARAQLLSYNDKNINQIAFACGYTDPGYFRRMFKRRTNMTPKEFRALYSHTHINTH